MRNVHFIRMYIEADFVLDMLSGYLGEREAGGSAPKFNCDGGTPRRTLRINR